MNDSTSMPNVNGPHAFLEGVSLRYPPCGYERVGLERDAIGSFDLVNYFSVELSQMLADIMQSMFKQQPRGNHCSDLNATFVSHWTNLWVSLLNSPTSVLQSRLD